MVRLCQASYQASREVHVLGRIGSQSAPFAWKEFRKSLVAGGNQSRNAHLRVFPHAQAKLYPCARAHVPACMHVRVLMHEGPNAQTLNEHVHTAAYMHLCALARLPMLDFHRV